MAARDYFRQALDVPVRGRGKRHRLAQRLASRVERHEVRRWLTATRQGADEATIPEPPPRQRMGRTPRDPAKLDRCCAQWLYGRLRPMGVDHSDLVAQVRAALPRVLRHEASGCVARALAVLTRERPADRLRVRDEFGVLSAWSPWREVWFRQAEARASTAWMTEAPASQEPLPTITETEVPDG